MEVSLEYLFSGFKEAYERTRDAKNETDPENLFHCLFETLDWMVAINLSWKRDLRIRYYPYAHV